MKLVIQIPCFNEEEQIVSTLEKLPQTLEGISEIVVLLIDDGSTDRTIEVAKKFGVEEFVIFPTNRGLVSAFQAGLQRSLELGADVIVNTDADGQYEGSSIGDLISPILLREADLVLGNRGTAELAQFSKVKRLLQSLGSLLASKLTKTYISDAASGFRAYSREAAATIHLTSKYTYTLESLVQIAEHNLGIANVQVGTTQTTRPSRLFKSMWNYTLRNGITLVRTFIQYSPLYFFSRIALVSFIFGSVSTLPFLVDLLLYKDSTGHLQSLFLAGTLIVLCFLFLAIGILADVAHSTRMTIQALYRDFKLHK